MGQAKQRGTKEQRIAQSLQRMDNNIDYLLNEWQLDKDKVINHFEGDAVRLNKFCDDLKVWCVKEPSLSLKFEGDELLISTTHPVFIPD